MNSDTDIFTKIADKYYTFTTSEKKILKQFILHYTEQEEDQFKEF